MKVGRPGEGVPAPIDPSQGAKGPAAASPQAELGRVAAQREKALSGKAAEILKRARSSSPGEAARATPEMIIGEAFERAFGRNPLASPDAPIGKAAAEAARQTPGFGEAVEAGRAAAADPENGELVQDFTNRVGALLTSGAGSDPLAMLFHVFKDSIAEQNADKKYMLQRLKEKNSVSSALADYLKKLSNELGTRALQEPHHPKQEGVLSRRTSGETGPTEPAAPPPSSPDPGTGSPSSPAAPAPRDLTTAELRAEIARVKREQTEVQGDSEMTANRLQMAMDRTAQLQGMLVRVMRSIGDTQDDLIRKIP